MSTSKTMYFGTQERMAWVKCPTTDADISKVGWSNSSLFLNGGASIRRSASSHKEYQFTWGLASAADIAAIKDYSDGIYGQGLIYFLDPFAMSYNLLPQYWAAPRLGAEDAPTFNGSLVRPTLVDTETNSLGYPTKSAVYTFDTSSEFAQIYIPLPTNYTFHFGAHGSSTGTAAVVVSTSSQSPTITGRINYVANPSLETNSTGWTASGALAVLTRPTTGGWVGSAFGRMTAGTATTLMAATNTGSVFPVTAGESFAFSAYVRGTVGRTASLRATWTGATATSGSTASVGSLTAWQRLSHTGTVPVGATAVRIDVVLAATGGLVGDVLDFDGVLAERGTSVVDTYFDGSTLSTSVGAVRTSNMWQSTADASASQQTITTAPGAAMTLLTSSTLSLTNYTVSGVSGVYVSFWGSGTLTLSGMVAQVLPTGTSAPTGNFRSGQGHSGCRFVGSPPVSGYSAPSALDLQSLSATLVETGAWE